MQNTVQCNVPKENVATENTAPNVGLHSSQGDQESTSWLCISLGRATNQNSNIEQLALSHPQMIVIDGVCTDLTSNDICLLLS